MTKFNVWGLAVTAGSMVGVGTMLFGWSAAVGSKAQQIVDMFSWLYTGYAPSFVGGIVGGMWAFVYWTLIAAIFASIYNVFVGER